MIPKKIKIGWKSYEVKHAKETLNSGDALYGQIDYDKQVITLRDSNTAIQDEATLVHEVLHGISDMYGLDLNEKTVTLLGDALYTVMRDAGITLPGD